MSNKRTIIRYDPCLTKAAKEIFGDIVSKAFKATWSYDSPLKAVITRLSEVNISYEHNEINYGTNDMMILFTSGKYVYFNGVDWISVVSVKLEEFEEL